jgi:hypothetical protein
VNDPLELREGARMFAKSVTTRARRFLMVLGTLGLAAVWAPAPVGAQQSPPSAGNFTIFFREDDPFRVCPAFDVKLEIGGKQGVLTLPNNLVILTSPALNVTVTNLATQEQVSLNITGTQHQEVIDGQVVLQVNVGSNLILRNHLFGDTVDTLAYVKGRYTFPPFSGVGTYTDICELLA